MNRMRGDITRRILEFISSGSEFTSAIPDSFLSYNQRLRKRDREGFLDAQTPSSVEKEKHRIKVVLYKLKKDGCLKAIDQRWKITKFGLAKLQRLIRQTSDRLPANNYEGNKSRTVTIVTFDIPEKKRRLRDWLRSALSNLGFTMMHRSVWVGKIELPKIFIEDIKDLGIEHYIHILSLLDI